MRYVRLLRTPCQNGGGGATLSGSFPRLGDIMKFYLRLVLVLGCLATFAGCGDAPPTGTAEVSDSDISLGMKGGGPTPMCVEGCLDPDPAPNAAGYYFPGTNRTPEGCTVGQDSDGDGLSNECEYFFALTFAPLMSFGLGDDVSREPHWAAMWSGSDSIAIMYMPAYYQDHGSPSIFCAGFGCDPHNGDPEYILLVIHHDQDTRHWSVKRAYLSAHDWHVPMVTAPSDSTPSSIGLGQNGVGFGYPDRVGGYPKIHVSDSKHANYPTKSYCDSHGARAPYTGIITSSDQCSNPRAESRIEVGFTKNVGSDSNRLIDCVTSSNPFHPAYSAQQTECFWAANRKFFGWFVFEDPDSPVSVYGDILRDHQFWGAL